MAVKREKHISKSRHSSSARRIVVFAQSVPCAGGSLCVFVVGKARTKRKVAKRDPCFAIAPEKRDGRELREGLEREAESSVLLAP